MRSLFTLIAFLFVGSTVIGQNSIAIKTDAEQVFVGDAITIDFQFNIPQEELSVIDFSAILNPENLAYSQDTVHLDKRMDGAILDGGEFGINDDKLSISKADFNDGKIPSKGSIKVAYYNLGALTVPSPTIEGPQEQILPLQRPQVIITGPESANQEDIADIKEIIKEEVKWYDYLPDKKYLIGLAIIALLGFGFYYWMKKREVTVDDVEPVIEEVKLPAHEIALQKLDALKAKELWQKGQTKEYHSELTYIMREYLTNRYDFHALEMTTSDIKKNLHTLNLSQDQIKKIIDILQIADVIKFAKGTASDEINEEFMREAYQFINSTKSLETNTEV